MKLIRVGDKYQKFLAENLKQFNYIRNQDGFNMSMICLNGIDGKTADDYIVYIRSIGIFPAYFGEEIIPGNYSGNVQYMKKKLIKEGVDITNIKFGKNFIWNNFRYESTPMENVIFFAAKLNGDKFEVNTTIQPIAYLNLPVFYKGKPLPYKFSDVRFFRTSNKILFYDGYITSIFEILLDKNTLYTSINMDLELPIFKKHTFYFNRDFCDNIREHDKNWAYIEEISVKTGGSRIKIGGEGAKYFSFLNWYENKSVSMTLLPADSKQKDCIKKFIIKQEGDVITGLDKEFLHGMFSFGVPFAAITQNNNEFFGISVGHTKLIHNAENYKNKKILKIIQDIRKLEKSPKFITHMSYYYLTYFICLWRKGDKYEMKISDSYLFIPNDNSEYKFSLNFPMSINIRKDACAITMGIGDYYNYMLTMKTADLVKDCKHDVAKFSIKKYNYSIKYL